MNLVKHLLSRNYDPSRYQTTWFDHADSVVTVPLYDSGKHLVGYQQYRPLETRKCVNHPREARYFTYTPRGKYGFWGLETLGSRKFVFVQEGVFDASPLHMLGLPAVAALSYTNKGLFDYLRMMGFKTLCLADNDESGLKLARKCDYSLVVPKGDVGDCTLEEVFTLSSMLLDQMHCRQ